MRGEPRDHVERGAAVLDPDELYVLADDLPELDEPVLVAALGGFVDAGSAGELVRKHLLGTLDNRVLATFDVDQLHDYRARRPRMLFVSDHWESYEAPRLALHEVIDAAGRPFLLLEGPEPDVQWERFVAAAMGLVERFGVRLTVLLGAIPMAVPHTRPLGLTAHATRPELVVEHEPWFETVQVPGSAAHLLEYRLGEAGRDAVGFAAHVPHYVSDASYPAAAVTLLEAVSRTAGLSLPTAGLEAAAAETRQALDAQVVSSPEVAAVVGGLEQQYDVFVSARGRSLLGGEEGELPSGEELGAELERFLAEEAGRGDGPT